MKSKAVQRLEQIVDAFEDERSAPICITITVPGVDKKECKLVEWHSPHGSVILEFTPK